MIPIPNSSTRFVALDIHKHYALIAAVDRDGEPLMKPRKVSNADLPDWATGHLFADDLVVIESTTNAWHVYDLLAPLVAEVKVANPIRIKQIAQARTKTDKRDALILAQIHDPLAQVSGDKGYDYETCHNAILARNAAPVIPPRKNARIHDTGQFDARDAILRRIAEIGRDQWKHESGYHRRSLAEVGVFRLKTIFGPKLRSRTLENQAVEVRLRCKAINMMTHMGMPDSYLVPTAA
jgi:hypothetical protein